MRFPYKKVKANTFGLSVTDILATEDKGSGGRACCSSTLTPMLQS